MSDKQVTSAMHEPVLLKETISYLNAQQGGLFVDCTLGLGGHSEAILEASAQAQVIGIDRDAEALIRARARLERFASRVRFRQANFKDIALVLDQFNVDKVDGMLADLGVSSFQLEQAERGFSFRAEAPLDMRMDTGQATTAADLVNSLGESELADIIYRYGEEPGSRRIARAIVRERQRRPIDTTTRLAEIVATALKLKGRRRIHPATRTFQALRIAVNEELENLEQFIEAAIGRLKSGGRLAIISFHSLEDRIVKQAFKVQSGQCICPPDLPVCHCGAQPRVEILTRKPVTPTEEELRSNVRARSAKLRVCRRV